MKVIDEGVVCCILLQLSVSKIGATHTYTQTESDQRVCE